VGVGSGKEINMRYSIKTKLDEKAYERDGFACVKCGRTKGIEAHHIIPELEELDNLITLCHACHKKRTQTKINKIHYFNRYCNEWKERVLA